jgi:prepilin-type N-terminal cleavage/methylation domain-containing protein
MTPSTFARRRAGFTLIEMMLSISIMLIVFAIAVPVFRSQLRAMGSHAGRFDAQQNVRFAISTLDRELRVAGAGVPDKQPMIVQADPYAITINADLATRDTAAEGGAFGAVYYDPDLPAGSTMSLTPANTITLPLSSVSYPTTTYYRGSGPQSAAETISYWIAPDGSRGSNGRYALYRRVNALPVDTVARGLVLDGTPPFTYVAADASSGALAPVLASALPAFHVQQHGAPDDTGSSALTDRIRSVRVHLTGTYVERNGSVSKRVADSEIRLLNAGLLNHTTCGDAPVFGSTVTATYVAGATRQVVVSWTRAVDESGGERDVEKYLIYRRAATASAFDEPIASIPAGQASYQFADTQIASGDQWVYAVSAADCGGQFSPLAVSSQVNVP